MTLKYIKQNMPIRGRLTEDIWDNVKKNSTSASFSLVWIKVQDPINFKLWHQVLNSLWNHMHEKTKIQ